MLLGVSERASRHFGKGKVSGLDSLSNKTGITRSKTLGKIQGETKMKPGCANYWDPLQSAVSHALGEYVRLVP